MIWSCHASRDWLIDGSDTRRRRTESKWTGDARIGIDFTYFCNKSLYLSIHPEHSLLLSPDEMGGNVKLIRSTLWHWVLRGVDRETSGSADQWIRYTPRRWWHPSSPLFNSMPFSILFCLLLFLFRIGDQMNKEELRSSLIKYAILASVAFARTSRTVYNWANWFCLYDKMIPFPSSSEAPLQNTHK